MKKLYRKGSVHPSPPLVSDQLSFLPAAILTLAAALTVEDREVLAYLISCSAANNNNNYIFVPTTSTATNPKKNRNGSSQTAPPPPPPPQDDVQRNKNKRKINVNDNGGKSSGGGEVVDHPASFDCNCFRCYMSYWIRWDSSPNRQLIHEIIDAYEDKLLSAATAAAAHNNGNNSNNKNKMSRRERKKRGGKKNGGSASSAGGTMDRNPELGSGQDELVRTAEPAAEGEDHDGEDGGGDEEMVEKGSVRKIVSFIGEKIWNVWG